MLKIAYSLQNEAVFPVVLATLVHISGSSYRRVGARALFQANGQRIGAISGGCLETDLQARSIRLLESGLLHEVVTYDTTDENDLLWGVGTGCHGVISVLLEVIHEAPSWVAKVISGVSSRFPVFLRTIWRDEGGPLGTRLSPTPVALSASRHTLQVTLLPPWHVVIFGAGDDAIPLANFVKNMEWSVTVVDPRAEMATVDRFPTADQCVVLPAENAVAKLAWDDRTVAVVMTHHYRFDLPLIRSLGPLCLPYLGLLGPRQRGQRIWRDAGLPTEQMDSGLHSPVGLDLGGDGPHAVALSIVAEIQAKTNQRSAQPLRQRQRPINTE